MKLFTKEFLSKVNFGDIYGDYMNTPGFISFEKDFIDLLNINLAVYMMRHTLKNNAPMSKKKQRTLAEMFLCKMLNNYRSLCVDKCDCFSEIYKLLKSERIENLDELDELVYGDPNDYWVEWLDFRNIYISPEQTIKYSKKLNNANYSLGHVQFLYGMRYLLERAKEKYNYYVSVAREKYGIGDERSKRYQREYDKLLDMGYTGDESLFHDLAIKELEEQNEMAQFTNLLDNGYSGLFEDMFSVELKAVQDTSNQSEQFWKGRKKVRIQDAPINIITPALVPNPATPPAASFGQMLQSKREQKELSQTALSEILKVTQKQVSRFEKGEAFPKANALLKICALFEIGVSSLMKLYPETKEIIEKEFKEESYKKRHRVFCAEYGTSCKP